MLWAFFLAFLGLLLLAGDVVLGLLAWRDLRTASLLGRPLSHIGKLQPGSRKVRGKVVPLARTLRSPMTNEECVYYRLRVDEDTSGSRSPFENEGSLLLARFVGGLLGVLVYKTAVAIHESAPSQYTLMEEAKSIPFAVEAESARVEVDLRGATVICKTKSRIRSDMVHPVLTVARLTDKLREEYGIHSVDDRGFSKRLKFVEEVLPAGAKVTVLGTVEAVEEGVLCFEKHGELLLVSERDIGKEGRMARKRATGFTAGAAGALTAALVLLLTGFVLAVRALFVH